ncbi:hypothetical protein CHELA1G11_21579 [Hyphomicrobiales bacterium]|nr:hypothetical protein CHELA1G11_21579 [Hyphomicrobiales bacterium]CAH1695096.1 hypothetical protein CHELA1G2_21883 [Hyphomicrobiales bacterium]
MIADDLPRCNSRAASLLPVKPLTSLPGVHKPLPVCILISRSAARIPWRSIVISPLRKVSMSLAV